MRRSKLPFRIVLLAALACAPLAALALEPVNADGHGVAIHGYDPVAYFEDGGPREGRPEFEHVWAGATWRFATAEHRDRFAANPEAYAPQYGGYCAYAVSENGTADIDPESWAIVEGRLFLNYSPRIQKKWQVDRDARIERADANWPALLGKGRQPGS